MPQTALFGNLANGFLAGKQFEARPPKHKILIRSVTFLTYNTVVCQISILACFFRSGARMGLNPRMVVAGQRISSRMSRRWVDAFAHATFPVHPKCTVLKGICAASAQEALLLMRSANIKAPGFVGLTLQCASGRVLSHALPLRPLQVPTCPCHTRSKLHCSHSKFMAQKIVQATTPTRTLGQVQRVFCSVHTGHSAGVAFEIIIFLPPSLRASNPRIADVRMGPIVSHFQFRGGDHGWFLQLSAC